MSEELLEKLLRERDEAIEKARKLETRWELLKEKVSALISACTMDSWVAYKIKERMRELEKDE